MISVVIPVYNVEQYLRRCIDSIIQQDIETRYEILLIDDGSKDNSGIICDEYQEKYPEIIRTFHKDNGGQSTARNEGIKLANGEWICFIDADDYVSESYLSTLEKLRQKFDADMSVISIKKTTENNVITEHSKRFEDFVLNRKDAFYETYVKTVFSWYPVGKMFRKRYLLKHMFPLGIYEDSGVLYLFIDECEKIAFGDYITEYHYINREDSTTTSHLEKRHYRIFEVCDEISQYIDEHYPEWQYVKVLMYQNAVLQLVNRTKMDKQQFSDVFMKYRKMFRQNLMSILMQKEVSFGKKYYAFILCLTPGIYKIQRKIALLILGSKP